MQSLLHLSQVDEKIGAAPSRLHSVSPIITTQQLIDQLPPKAKQIVESQGHTFSKISADSQVLTTFLEALYNDSKVDAAPILGCFGTAAIKTPYYLHLKVFRPTILLRIAKIFTNIVKLTISVKESHLKETNLDFIFRQFPNLSNLALIGPGIPKKLPDNVQKLSLTGSVLSTLELDRLLTCYKHLEQVTFRSCHGLTSDAPLSIGNHRNIESLRFIDCRVSQIAFWHLIEKCTLLNELKVEKCPLLTSLQIPTNLQARQTQFEFLRNLLIANIPIEETELKKSIESLPDLQTLCIDNCTKISSNFFSSCNFGSKIKIIDLETVAIDRKGLENIFAKAHELTALRLSNCPNLTTKDFVEVSFPTTLTEICFQDVAINLQGACKIQSYLLNLERISYDCPTLPDSLKIENVSLDDAFERTPSPYSETDSDELQFELEI